MPAAPTWPDDAIEVGRVVDAWGVKGWLKVQPFSSEPQALLSARQWFLKSPAADASRPAAPRGTAVLPPVLSVKGARRHGEAVVAGADEVPDRTAAEALKGARVFVSRSTFPQAEDGEYYWIDLIGLSVVNREGALLGTVADLIDTGPHTVLRVTPEPGRAGQPDTANRADGQARANEAPDERLIPFVAAYVDAVNLAERRIDVDWGLDY